MNTNDQIVKEVLLHQSYVTPDDVVKAERFAKEHNTSLVDYFFTSGLINRNLLGQAVAEAFKVPFFNLATNPPSPEQILKIPKDVALQYYLVLAEEEPTKVTIATANPGQEHLQEQLQKLFPGKIVTLAYSFPKDIESLFVHYRQPLIARLSQALKDGYFVLTEMKRLNIKIPVIVASNLGQQEDIEKAKQLGAIDYFVKSDVTLVEMVNKVKQYLQ